MRTLAPVGLALLACSALQAQEARPMLRLFLDCPVCDQDYVRTEIDFVEFVRDRTAGDVHLLITSQATGAGGRQYALNFIGTGDFVEWNDTLTYSNTRDHTADDTRRELTRVIKVGLMRYLAQTPLASRLEITLEDPVVDAPAVQRADDPWDYWVFTVGANGSGNGESQTTSYGFSGRLSASRTTDMLKVSLSVNASYNESRFDVPDSEPIRSFRRTYSGNALVVHSVTGHVSAGMNAGISSSTFGNQRLGVRVGPALEYAVFPYEESTRRAFNLMYSVGVASFDYRERTIYDVTEETRATHGIQVSYNTRQPWGSTSISLDASQYLHDTTKYQASIFANASIRLFGGFSLGLTGSYARIRDQLSLAAGALTQEEILLRQRQLATNYRYFTSFGLTYRFGSVVNTIVNPRFEQGTIFF